MMQCTVSAAIRLAVCEPRSCRDTFRAVSAMPRQELQILFNDKHVPIPTSTLTRGKLYYMTKCEGEEIPIQSWAGP
jgi:hypothetical protein